MRVYDVIEAKKHSRELSEEEIRFLIRCIADGSASDAQIAAFCMATLLNGMTQRECFLLTDAMAHSGEVCKRPDFDGIFADKHSTGGVSDSTTLVIVPILCSLGIYCAKYSGRGLGHTGGTLDKLESFPGLNVDLTAQEFEEQIRCVGGAVAGQTKDIVPADKRMYAVRDVTATVDSIPLIASSVMSKKLASFADILLLDVKYGDGAFMHSPKDAERLARLMVSIGRAAGRKTMAAITCMDSPLGDGVGCNLEVRDAIEVLQGKKSPLAELSFYLCVKILCAAKGISQEQGYSLINEAVRSKAALQKLAEIVQAQGGDPSAVFQPSLLPLAEKEYVIRAKAEGALCVSAMALGRACVLLGGGREKAGDLVDHTVGILLKKRTGDFVSPGDELAVVYASKENPQAEDMAKSAFQVRQERETYPPLVYKFIGSEESVCSD